MDANCEIKASGAPVRCCPPPPRPGPDGLRRFAALFKALADPTRLEMIELMAQANGSLCVCDVESCFDLSQPTISHHLGLLRKAGLVLAERRGTWMHYTLSPFGLEQLREFHRELGARS
jgi:ArsR family transcriptional regulator